MNTPADIHILHVDDEPGFAETAAELLEREEDRFAVETATSAREALDRLGEVGYDCIVSDYDMPETNGIEFLETVRERYPDLPFILYTGKGSEVVASDAISSGVTDYLQKKGGTDQYTILANRIRNAVAARRSAVEAEQSRYRLAQILKTVPSCVVQLDDEGDFVFANERAVTVLGLEETDLTDRAYNDPEWHITDLNGEPIPDAELPFRQVRDSGEPLYGFKHGIEWADGTRKIISVNGAPLFDEDGAVDSVVFSITDITEQWESAERLQETTARLGPLFENSPDMINVHDLEGNILDPNPRLCEETGYDEAELLGMKVWEVDAEIGPDEAQALWEGMEPGAQTRLESVFRRRDGSEFPVEVHVRRFSVDGTARFMVISRDITERVERRRELERQNERLDGFAGVVSHDLRNPLSVASGRAELAQQECDSEHLDAVVQAHDRMDALIDDLLTLAQDGQGATDLEPVSLVDVVEGCWRAVETADATVLVRTEQTVQADRNRLQRLLENLFRNAVEHGGESVTVTVGALEGGGGFYVADDGPGIPPEERETVFGAGYSTADGGTGFGLNIVQKIAGAHGWAVTVTDSEGGGARFEVSGVETGAA